MEMSTPSEQPVPEKSKPFDLAGLAWWQMVLAVAPLALIFFGGLLGGLCGAAAAVANIRIAKGSTPAGVKELIMVGVDVAAVVVWYIVASALLDAIN
jgi:hypothetical protein